MNAKLTVFFEDPFWVGVFEKVSNGRIEVCRVVFGAEPKDYEVYAFILRNYYQLEFSQPMKIDTRISAEINPKRLRRKIDRQLKNTGIGTKAQQAMKQNYEACKIEQKRISKERKQEKEEAKFIKAQEKKKQKKRGH